MNDEIKKVGRPKKENALSNAERQKKLREKKKIQEEEKIEISKIKELLIKTKKEHEERYFNSVGEEKIKNYAMATAITHFDILFDRLIK